MKVFLYGNTLNISYYFTLFLRAKGIDAEMYLDNTSPHGHDYPWWEDAALRPDNLPPWIHYYKTRPFFLLPNRKVKKMIRDFGKCDVALVFCNGPIVAMKAKVPFLFFSIGSDLNGIDTKDELKSIYHGNMGLNQKLRRLVKIISYTPLQKKAILHYASRIGVAMGYQWNPYIKKFGLESKTFRTRMPYDTEKYATATDKKLFERYKQYDLVFLLISRHSWKKLYNDIKGNDKFLKAYARFVKNYNPNARLLLLKKGIDFKESEKLVNELGLNDNVEWLEMMDKDGVRAFESLPNLVVADQFWHDEWFKRFTEDKDAPKIGFGFAGIEAMAAGRPLITAFKDPEYYENNEPPVLSAFTIEEIYARLIEVYKMTPEERAGIGKRQQEFVNKWHNYQNTIDIYISELQKIAASRTAKTK